MTTQELGDAILRLIEVNGDTTFAEIMKNFGEEAKGDLAWEIAPNIVLWSGMSEKLIAAFELIRDRIEPRVTSVWCYLFDGAFLQLPIAKKPPRGGYKEQHWAPVAFYLRREPK